MAFAAHSINFTTVAFRIPSFWQHLVSLKSSSKLQSQYLHTQERTQKSANASRRSSMRALDSSTLHRLLPSTRRKILKTLGQCPSLSSSEPFLKFNRISIKFAHFQLTTFILIVAASSHLTACSQLCHLCQPPSEACRICSCQITPYFISRR